MAGVERVIRGSDGRPYAVVKVRPIGLHPVLVFTGEQGAAKTTLLRVCRRLIDPNASPVRAKPKELLETLSAQRRPNTTRPSDWPKSPRLLSVKLRELAPQLRCIGINVEFVRERKLRIVTVAIVERSDELATDYQSAIIGGRVRALIEEENREVAPTARSRKPA